MIDQDEDIIPADRLAQYEVPKAPPQFVDRVMTRIAARPRRRRWPWIAGAATACAMAAAMLVLFTTAREKATVEERDSHGTAEQIDMLKNELDGKADHIKRLKMDLPKNQQVELTRELDQRTAELTARISVARPADPTAANNLPNTEAYARIDDNPFITTASRPLSTFSVDVDTASYANTRRFLTEGHLPPKDAVRIEELINYFHYDYPAPAHGEPFSITTEVGASPWNPAFHVARIGLHASPIEDAQVPARNLVFLIDVSGSMESPNKLPLLKQALGQLVDTLRPQDKVSIVVYAGASGLALPATAGQRKDVIRNAIARLEPGGSTNGAAGIKLAYNIAELNTITHGVNRVILCTDGDFNVGVTSEGELTRLIEHERERGVFLTVLGFGMGNVKDATMEKLADRGNGNYAYIDSLAEARKVLVKEAGATLVTVAKDVKLQVEFNPATVAGYRLIGYENRALRDEDFADDKQDAGDIGAGHSVTALYEIVPAGVAVPAVKVDALKYQTKPSLTKNAELMTVKIRYKAPDADKSKLLAQAVPNRVREPAAMSADFRWVIAIGSFGMLLRESHYRGNLTWKDVEAMAKAAVGEDREGYRAEAVRLIHAANTATR